MHVGRLVKPKGPTSMQLFNGESSKLRPPRRLLPKKASSQNEKQE